MASSSRNKGNNPIIEENPQRTETGIRVPRINLKVRGQRGDEQIFRIKRDSKLQKLMDAYYYRQSETPNTVVFLYDGRRLRGEETPDSLKMEDGDEIDAMIHQTGGSLMNYA